MKNRCAICHNDAGAYRLCPSCYSAHFAPCPDCSKPTPQLSKFNKPTRGTCVACTARRNAPTRRIGKTCVICGNRFQTRKRAHTKCVCNDCMKITALCPYCGKPMPRYKEKGGERKFCSLTCNAKAVPGATRSVAAKKANQTKWQGHIYKSHQNKIARGNIQYTEWRKAVYERDNYTCQDCGKHGGEIHPHHIKAFATFPALRYEVSNGVTLCKSCHRKRHNHVFIGRTKRVSIQLHKAAPK